MSVDYTIAAIPTVYRGRQYRSRLEARWAAFFDLVGWAHEYEPFDLGKWSPDFVLKGAARDVLVEVKPITEYDAETGNKIWEAALEKQRKETLLIVGVSPSIREIGVHLGWVLPPAYEEWRGFEESPAFFRVLPGENGVLIDFGSDFPAGWLSGLDTHYWRLADGSSNYSSYRPDLLETVFFRKYQDELMAQWGVASNTVQWRGPSRK